MIPLIYTPHIDQYHFGTEHPFYQERYSDFVKLLKGQGYGEYFSFVPPTSAHWEDILSVHTARYVERIKSLEGMGRLTLDTPLLPGIIEAGRLLMGHGLKAMEMVMAGNPVAVTFGGTHHAGRDYGGGFCLFNDVAIIAQKLINLYGLERILILDIDAHHGNGTQEIFYESKKVLYISLHQDPRTLYPGTGFVDEIGKGTGKGYTVNIPLLAFSGDEQYLGVLNEIVHPLVNQFDPQAIIRNGGSDIHHLDGLTHLGVTCKGLYAIGETVRLMSSGCNRLIDLTLSGYNKDVLPYAWLSLTCGVCNLLMPTIPPQFMPHKDTDNKGLGEATGEIMDKIRRILGKFWNFP
jgi:acetoin utilization protein AcuC